MRRRPPPPPPPRPAGGGGEAAARGGERSRAAGRGRGATAPCSSLNETRVSDTRGRSMSMDITAPAAGEYTDKNIVTLKDAAHIRQNPGMYVGNTQSAGLHHLVYEIVYNSVDEALDGYCTQIRVVLHKDGSVSISDDGRGIPIGVKPGTGKSTLEEVLTI